MIKERSDVYIQNSMINLAIQKSLDICWYLKLTYINIGFKYYLIYFMRISILLLITLLVGLTFSLRYNHEIHTTQDQSKTLITQVTPPTFLSIRARQLVTNPLAKNVIVDKRQQISWELRQRLDDNITDYDACLIKTPFFNGRDCIQCPDYFNLNTKNCTACSAGTKYDPESLKCVRIIFVTNLDAERLLSKDRKLQDWKDFQKRLIETSPSRIQRCTIDAPFSSHGKCIKCEGALSLFDLITDTCTACSSNKSYNKQLRQCSKDETTSTLSSITPVTAIPIVIQTHNITSESKVITPQVPPKYLINPDTYGLIIDNSSVQQYIAKYKVAKDNNVQDCPNTKPYYDGKQCIACGNDDSKFRISDRKCTHCLDGTYYLYAKKKCVPN